MNFPKIETNVISRANNCCGDTESGIQKNKKPDIISIFGERPPGHPRDLRVLDLEKFTASYSDSPGENLGKLYKSHTEKEYLRYSAPPNAMYPGYPSALRFPTLRPFIGEAARPETFDNIVHHVEDLIAQNRLETEALKGRTFRSAEFGSERLINPVSSYYDPTTETLTVHNAPAPLLGDVKKKTSYITSFTWDTRNGDLSIQIENEEFLFVEDSEGVLKENKKEQFRRKIRYNLVIRTKTRGGLINGVPKEEWTAIETLREMISEKEFRKYMKYGFLMVEGKSGDIYQVFRNKSHTKVWRSGEVIEEVCVRLDHSYKAPPTDNVIAFAMLIQYDESEFKKLGNVYKMKRAA